MKPGEWKGNKTMLSKYNADLDRVITFCINGILVRGDITGYVIKMIV